ncbi:apolipoprotein A1/A4/E family protein [Thiotrichales bacterium 19X7-9]|nr:apolipoprotein A1/A4/E family protein [Thiotrichales bacterium 19X7-9]
MKLSDMLKKAEEKLKTNNDTEEISAPWETTSIKTTLKNNSNYQENHQGTIGGQLEDTKGTIGGQLEDTKGTIGGQLEDTKGTIGGQLEDTKGTIGGQLEDTKGTIGGQLEDTKGTIGGQLEDTKGTIGGQLEDTKGTIGGQLDLENIYAYIDSLGGKQLLIIQYIVLNLDTHKSYETTNLKSTDICRFASISKDSFKTHIRRLIKKNILVRLRGKTSLHGFVKFKINKPILTKIKTILGDSNKEKTSIYNSNIITTDNNSNDVLNEKDLLITKMQKQIKELQQQKITFEEMDTNITNLENDFSTVDFSELSEFGFKKSHLDQIKSFGTVTPEVAQESINHYAWALHNRKEEMQKYAPEKNRFKGLFGVLRKGNAWTEDGYIDPIDEAIQKSLDAKRKKLAQVKKQKEEMFSLDFELWKESLSEDDLNKINNQIKSKTQGRKSGAMYEAALKDHFKNNFHTSR